MANNLLQNGGFESGDLTGWSIFNPGRHPGDIHITADPGRVQSGLYAVSIDAFAGGADPLKLIASVQVGQYPVGTLLHARVMLRSDNLVFADPKASFSFLLVAADAAGKTLVAVTGNSTLVGSYAYLPNDILLSLPEGAATVALHFSVPTAIQSGSIQIDDAALEVIDDPGDSRADIPLCQVIKNVQGTPRLWIDGQRRTPVIFFGNHGTPVIYDEIAKAATAGVDIVQIPMSLPWNGVSTGMIEQAIKINPKALFLPRVFLHPPQVWLDQHQDQLILNENHEPSALNNFASMASDVFFDACKQQIEILIRYLQNSPYRDRIIGYHPDYLAECFFYYEMEKHFFDYSEVNRIRFTCWLEAKYGNVEQLNHAWQTSLASISEAVIPPAADWVHGDDGLFRDPANPRAVAVADYQMYFNNLTAERLIELAELIKRLTADRSLVAYFYGMQNEFIVNGHFNGIGHSGHLGTRRVLASPAIDMICAPTSYYDRAPGKPMNMMGIVDSVSLAGKLYLEEDDSRTWLWKEPPAPDYWSLKTEWDTLQCLRRNFGNVIGHNQAIWWMDLCSNGNFNADSIWQSNRKIIETYADSIEQALPTRPQVALIYDEDIFFWLKANCRSLTSPNLVAQRSVFQSLGAQVGYYYIEDLPRIPDSARLIVFVSAFHVTPEKEALIEAMKQQGRTLLWLYAPGYIGSHDLSLERMQRLTGFAFKKYDRAIDPEIRIVSDTNRMLEPLAGKKTGSTAYAKPFAPTFYGAEPGSDSLVLGRYTANAQPAILYRQHPDWTSIFYGSPLLSVPVLRGICREAGVTLLVDADDLNTEDAVNFNGRYLYIYARGHAGRRTFHVPADLIPSGGLTIKEVMSGHTLAEGVSDWTDDLALNEQKIYQLLPSSSSP